MLRQFLAKIELSEHLQAFEDNDIDLDVLPDLTSEDLAEIGLTNVERDRLRSAINADPGLRRRAMPARDPASQRASVLCASIANATYLSTVLDAEYLAEAHQTFENLFISCMSMWGGKVASRLHTMNVATFGYQDAEIHSAEHAVYAGLDLIQQTKRAGCCAAEPFCIKVSISTGRLAVRGTTRQYYPNLIAGEAPSLAKGLHEIADPHALIISDRTKDLVGDLFAPAANGRQELIGFPHPVPSWSIRQQTIGAGQNL